MKRTWMTLAVAAMVSLGSFAPGVATAASKLQNLENEKNQVQQQRSNVNSEINETKSEISKIKGDQRNVKEEMKRLDLAIGDTNDKIREKTNQIATTKAEIEQLKVEIVELTERINKRNELLKDRARTMQETGGAVSYIDVLLGAESFSDFVDRVGAIATIMEADKDILDQHRADKELLEKKQQSVEDKLANLEAMRADLETMKKRLTAQKIEKDKLMASLKKQERQLEHEKLALEEKDEILAAQEAAMKKAIQLEKQRQAQLAKPKPNSNAGGGSANLPAISSGSFTRPANGHLSSGFGARWNEHHAGIDIANSGSNVPIVAAADGVVIRSYYSTSYGNAIFISHSIDGQIFTTVYAHMSSRVAGSGAAVSKGQLIGYMGNTGYSFGQHLHFELHKGPWNAAKSNAINPLNYIGY